MRRATVARFELLTCSNLERHINKVEKLQATHAARQSGKRVTAEWQATGRFNPTGRFNLGLGGLYGPEERFLRAGSQE